MFNNTWNTIVQWFSDRSERNKLLRSFNKAARDAFISGVAPTLLEAKFSKGNSSYKHQFSNWLSSGFRIQAFSGRQLTKDELMFIGQVILNDGALVRKLVVLGFDTLEVHGDKGSYGLRWQLKDHIMVGQSGFSNY